MNEIFTIGDFCFRVLGPADLELPVNFLKFRGGTAPCYTYTLAQTSDFLPPAGLVLTRRPDLLVVRNGGGETRYIGIAGSDRPYACYRETGPAAARIELHRDLSMKLEFDPMAVSLFALERRMLERDALILHCAVVEHRGEAILFSAPSGTGKTTQANLWERYRGAETVNGDRGLLQKIGGRWHARGWPVCGSSGVCANRDVPIRAIVTLSQASADRAERLSPMKAFTRIYSQTTVNRWDPSANLRAMELIEQIAADIPVYHLACTMNESAVETLEVSLGG